MKKDISIGAVIYKLDKDKIFFLIIKHAKGHWAFPKGHGESGETEIQTAKRELFEETGIDNIYIPDENTMLEEYYSFNNPDTGIISKKVKYFIAKCISGDVNIDDKEIVDYRWCEIDKAVELITFGGAKKIINDANNIIREKFLVNG